MQTLFRIDLPYATFGVIVEDGTVREAPPIAAWAISRTWVEFCNWVSHKGGSTIVVRRGEDVGRVDD